MNAGENLDVIQSARARTEEALAAIEHFTEELNKALAAVTALFEGVQQAAQTAATTVEQAHQGAAGALQASDEHLNATPGDHSTVMAIISAKNSCETATMGLGNAYDEAQQFPERVEGTIEAFTDSWAVFGVTKLEEISGQIAQAKGELDTAETNIASVQG